MMKLIISSALLLLYTKQLYAGECAYESKETGWVPASNRNLYQDVLFASTHKDLRAIENELGPPARKVTYTKSEATWVYGAKKIVSEKTCEKTENKTFFEVYLLTIGGEKDDVTCRVLRRTIVSTAENISPFQEEGVLPFTLENNSCGDWLASNRKF